MANGTMSRADMEAVIKSGGSVLHKGEVYSSVDALPTEADLAVESNDDDQLQAQIDKLLEQQAKHKAQIAALKSAQQQVTEQAAAAEQAAQQAAQQAAAAQESAGGSVTSVTPPGS